MVMITSAPATADAADCAALPPTAANLLTAAATTSLPVTACPALTRLAAMGRPMLPSPMKPMRAMSSSSNRRCAALAPRHFFCFLLRPFARGHQGNADIGDHQRQFGRNHPQSPAEDLGKQQLDARHGDGGGEPPNPAQAAADPKP